MSTTVKTGWLKDSNGDKFAPKTLSSQVQTSDGILFEDKIQADLDNLKSEIKTDLENIDLSTYETTENAQSKLDEAKDYTDTVASGKADLTHNHDSAYDSKGSADTALENAKTYTDTKTSGLAPVSSIPTKTSQLTNDSGYVTEDIVTPITTTEIDEICGASILAASEVEF